MHAMRRSSERMLPPRPPSSSSSLSGVIGRSKFHLRHPYRSHKFRLTSSGTCTLNYSPDDAEDDDHMPISDFLKKRKLNQESSVEEDGKPSHFLIKSHRAKRVYSPQSAGGIFSCSSPNVVESKVRSGCAEEVWERGREIHSLGEKLPSESWSKDEISLILSSIVSEYGCERLDNVNGVPQLTTPPDDIQMCDNVKVDGDGVKQVDNKDEQLTGKAEESLCSHAGAINNSLKSKSVLRPRMQRKLFKSPGSVSYRRLLPFITNMIKDDSGALISGHCQNDEKVDYVKQFQLPLSSLSLGASRDQLRTDSCPKNDNDELRVLTDKSDLSCGNESKLASYQDLPEWPKQVVHDCSPVPSVNEQVENVEISFECSSNIEAEEVEDARYDKDIANAVPNNLHGCKVDAMHSVDTSETICVLNQQCLSFFDDDICVENTNAPGSIDVINTLDLTPSNQVDAGEQTSPNTTTGKDNFMRNKFVFKPCLQKKLFKTPGSVSYKRLLPFLKDIAQDNCGASKLCSDQKDERGMRSQPPLLFQSQESPIDEHKTDTFPVHDTVEEANAIQDNTIGDCNSGCSLNLPNSVAKIDSSFTPSSPIVNEITLGEQYTSVSHQLSDLTEVKRDSSSNGVMHLNTDLCRQKLQAKTFERCTIPTVGLRKGILKRNPRGCRGHCTCLNCASFRLHADRAFEFSRNMFLDAKEVALDLMKELSQLRNMLERQTDGANNHSVLDENQVKEACKKAIEAEQLAKERFSEMEDDLDIHCRIKGSQQPRVKFAYHIEEKVISPGRLSRQK